MVLNSCLVLHSTLSSTLKHFSLWSGLVRSDLIIYQSINYTLICCCMDMNMHNSIFIQQPMTKRADAISLRWKQDPEIGLVSMVQTVKTAGQLWKFPINLMYLLIKDSYSRQTHYTQFAPHVLNEELVSSPVQELFENWIVSDQTNSMVLKTMHSKVIFNQLRVYEFLMKYSLEPQAKVHEI